MCTPLPLSSFYLPTDRILRELRQRVFHTETEISLEAKPVGEKAQLAQAWGRGEQGGRAAPPPCSLYPQGTSHTNALPRVERPVTQASTPAAC